MRQTKNPGSEDPGYSNRERGVVARLLRGGGFLFVRAKFANYTVESEACRPRAYSSSAMFADVMTSSASATAAIFAPGTTM